RATACAKAACARSTRSRRGRAWTMMRSAPCGSFSTSAGRTRPRDEALDLLLRPDLALRVPRVRAAAAGARRAVGQRRLRAGAVRLDAGALGPEGPGGDRAQARLDFRHVAWLAHSAGIELQ